MLTVQDAERMDLMTPQDAEVTYCRVDLCNLMIDDYKLFYRHKGK